MNVNNGNIRNIMAQAQRMQREITAKQEEIYKMHFTGKSEWVTITMTGKKEIVKFDITYTGSLDADRDMFADMVTIAMKDCLKKIDAEIQNKLGMYSDQLAGLM